MKFVNRHGRRIVDFGESSSAHQTPPDLRFDPNLSSWLAGRDSRFSRSSKPVLPALIEDSLPDGKAIHSTVPAASLLSPTPVGKITPDA
jgi:hypothetical protein